VIQLGGWHVACSIGMKKILLVSALVTVSAALARAEQPRLGGREAPRATDLLRAEKLAEQAQRRLRAPARRGPGWRHGGSGWNDVGHGGSEPSESVIINVNPPRRRAAPR
jgi:hypothetical protein